MNHTDDQLNLERELAAATARAESKHKSWMSELQRLAAVTAERDVLKADLCTFAVDMEKQLSAVTAERDSMVARFRDEINQRQETQRANAIIDAAILSASQQEAQRLREALVKISNDTEFSHSAKGEFNRKCWYIEVANAALSSTPAPAHAKGQQP